MKHDHRTRTSARLTVWFLALASVALPSPAAAEDSSECASLPPPEGEPIGGVLIIDSTMSEERVGAGVVLDVLAGYIPPGLLDAPSVIGASVDYSECVKLVQCVVGGGTECRP